MKIVQNRWAYKRPYHSTAERIAAPPGFLAYCNGYPRAPAAADLPVANVVAHCRAAYAVQRVARNG